MKKGFTLIEMIAVIVIMALITALIVPSLVNQVNNKKDTISGASKKMIYAATELYMDDNSNYSKSSGQTYCIMLDDLVKKGFLEKNIKDIDNNEISLNWYVKVTFNNYGEPEYEVIKKCTN